uniref:NADH-ubiquinone oxidoreductase chain 3 n=1 Tax=Uraeotyphlus cf. oxyurus MW-212 TaxID=262585 RepID=Q64JN8_9AMPH|nr:NADH dehydrogenase subunit 3 [Uraeotyphlus cf. oxyurus MW-212]AAS13751.1 NADH dehydrogenase subunit 3 [Uraeotyphlus cf. oxyurus MW-212]
MTLITVCISTALTMALMMIAFWLPNMTQDAEKLSPYECGFDPLGSARLPFSVRFFLVAILFLLFDLEIALLLPAPWASQLDAPSNLITLATIILLLLTIGLMYEWLQGGLDWAE